MIAARAASSSESIYNVKNTNLRLKRLAPVFESKIILFLSYVYIFLIAFIENQKSYKKSHLCLHYTFLISFNTARESDKSYMINHVVYFGL